MRNSQSTLDMLEAIVLGILYNTKNVNNLNDEYRLSAVVAENGKVVNKIENDVLVGNTHLYTTLLAIYLKEKLSNLSKLRSIPSKLTQLLSKKLMTKKVVQLKTGSFRSSKRATLNKMELRMYYDRTTGKKQSFSPPIEIMTEGKRQSSNKLSF